MIERDPAGAELETQPIDVERIQHALGQYGIYDASVDNYLNPPEAESLWPQNPCIVPGID